MERSIEIPLISGCPNMSSLLMAAARNTSQTPFRRTLILTKSPA